jgi:uncharacterized protein
MSLDLLQYDRMVEKAMRTVVRDALTRVAADGLPGQHHFYISFRTEFPGVRISDALKSRFPEDMTIVLQHQFWGLAVHKESFDVTLSFSGVQEKLTIPFAAITGFVDPSVKFGLQFRPDAEAAVKENAPAKALGKPAPAPEGPAQIVALDAFRKK